MSVLLPIEFCNPKDLNKLLVMETFLLHLHITGHDVRGHVTRSLQVKMPHHVWTDGVGDEMFLSEIITEKNRTTPLDSNELLNKQNILCIHCRGALNFVEILEICFLFYKSSRRNAAEDEFLCEQHAAGDIFSSLFHVNSIKKTHC